MILVFHTVNFFWCCVVTRNEKQTLENCCRMLYTRWAKNVVSQCIGSLPETVAFILYSLFYLFIYLFRQ